jgi:microcystin-dependent protein
MAKLSLNELKARFATADQPTQKDFSDLIDTMMANIQAAIGNPVPGGAYYYAPATLTGASPGIYVASYSPSVSFYNDGTVLAFKADVANPAGGTQFSGGPAPALLVKECGGSPTSVQTAGVPLAAGDIQPGQIVEVRFEGITGHWRVISSLSRPGHETGDVIVSASAVSPGGNRLLCDGSSYLRSDYPNLYAAIGTAFGSVDGTHFNVPDMRRHFPIGVGPFVAGVFGEHPDLAAINLGTVLGEEYHELLTTELPAHTHNENIAKNLTVPDGGIVDPSAGVFVGPLADGGTEIISKATGGSLPHNNMPPGVGFYFYIIV